jgi:hypothetical protein
LLFSLELFLIDVHGCNNVGIRYLLVPLGMEVVKDGPLHEDVEEERDLRVGPVRVPVPLVRPTLYSKSGNKRKDYRGSFKEIKLSRLS